MIVVIYVSNEYKCSVIKYICKFLLYVLIYFNSKFVVF